MQRYISGKIFTKISDQCSRDMSQIVEMPYLAAAKNPLKIPRSGCTLKRNQFFLIQICIRSLLNCSLRSDQQTVREADANRQIHRQTNKRRVEHNLFGGEVCTCGQIANTFSISETGATNSLLPSPLDPPLTCWTTIFCVGDLTIFRFRGNTEAWGLNILTSVLQPCYTFF